MDSDGDAVVNSSSFWRNGKKLFNFSARGIPYNNYLRTLNFTSDVVIKQRHEILAIFAQTINTPTRESLKRIISTPSSEFTNKTLWILFPCENQGCLQNAQEMFFLIKFDFSVDLKSRLNFMSCFKSSLFSKCVRILWLLGSFGECFFLTEFWPALF